ncbi:DUF4200 domain-containing protein [Chryseobacterium sp. PMSZPI]|uniref:DUF4200 domain-containing protein n=1 Tax=Chryseobacterium sp. PMSZPI TaxID=1033900 RepID=UPI000C320BBD|nr:DUF4200 domain-containing protein [Chryseobacterium sp. PMSZPI]PKF74768.1 cell wall anchor protein [Chryseobacterium sp. PMSZPI]
MKRTLLIAGTIFSSLIYAQNAGGLTIHDTRSINDLPSVYKGELKAEFKFRDVVGVPGTGNYSGMLTIAPWNDNSGNKNHQLNFNDGGVFYRNALSNDPQWGSWSRLVMQSSDGKVRIGYINDNDIEGDSPLVKLNVNGNARFSDFISTGSNSWIFHTPDDSRKTLHIAPRNAGNTDWDWLKSFVINGENGNALLFGKFEAKEMKITLTPTADFVFEESYNLPRLEDIEKHIKMKKHLPEIASAKVMEKEGVNVGEFQIKLLQKIEELTLYSIQQNKEIKKLQEENQTLKSQSEKIEKMEKQVQKLLSAQK